MISYSSQTRSVTPIFLLRLLDSLMVGNILTKFKKIYRADVFQGNDHKIQSRLQQTAKLKCIHLAMVTT